MYYYNIFRQARSHYIKLIKYYSIFILRKITKQNISEKFNEYYENKLLLKKNGYTSINNFYEVNKLNKIRNSIDLLIEKKKNVEFDVDIETKNNLKNQVNNKITNITLKEPLLDIPEMNDLVFDLRLKSIADYFFGVDSFITGINVRKTIANDSEESGVQLYHVDRNNHKILKFFIYLNSVDTEGGPTTFIKGTNKKKHTFWYAKHRYSEDEIFKIYNKKNKIEFCSSIGSINILDTTSYHKGKKPKVNNRYMITITYGIVPERVKQSFKLDSNQISKLNLIQKKNLSEIIN